jgi:hypothetical protein
MKPTKITLAWDKTPGVNEHPLQRNVRPCPVPTNLLRYGNTKLLYEVHSFENRLLPVGRGSPKSQTFKHYASQRDQVQIL